MITTDYDHIVAMSRTLSENDTLFKMVDGKFEIDFPAKNVLKVLKSKTNDNQTMISVSLPNVVSAAMMGYNDSGRVDCTGMFQVDIASLKGNNSKYCRDVANAVKCLIEGDVTKELLAVRYNIYIDRVNDNTFFDEEIGAWHSALIIYGEYIKCSK